MLKNHGVVPGPVTLFLYDISLAKWFIIFHQPRFPSNKRDWDPSDLLPFGGPGTRVRSRNNLTKHINWVCLFFF